jgi:hypothetical protein
VSILLSVASGVSREVARAFYLLLTLRASGEAISNKGTRGKKRGVQ